MFVRVLVLKWLVYILHGKHKTHTWVLPTYNFKEIMYIASSFCVRQSDYYSKSELVKHFSISILSLVYTSESHSRRNIGKSTLRHWNLISCSNVGIATASQLAMMKETPCIPEGILLSFMFLSFYSLLLLRFFYPLRAAIFCSVRLDYA